MSSSRVRRVLNRLSDGGARRPQLSVAAYRSAFEADRDDAE